MPHPEVAAASKSLGAITLGHAVLGRVEAQQTNSEHWTVTHRGQQIGECWLVDSAWLATCLGQSTSRGHVRAAVRWIADKYGELPE